MTDITATWRGNVCDIIAPWPAHADARLSRYAAQHIRNGRDGSQLLYANVPRELALDFLREAAGA